MSLKYAATKRRIKVRSDTLLDEAEHYGPSPNVGDYKGRLVLEL
jgi:hypothetical protein